MRWVESLIASVLVEVQELCSGVEREIVPGSYPAVSVGYLIGLSHIPRELTNHQMWLDGAGGNLYFSPS